jgi:hypothetical protein
MWSGFDGIRLNPNDGGIGCPGNGSSTDEQGFPIECCCDECDYYQLCWCESGNNCGACLGNSCPLKKE